MITLTHIENDRLHAYLFKAVRPVSCINASIMMILTDIDNDRVHAYLLKQLKPPLVRSPQNKITRYCFIASHMSETSITNQTLVSKQKCDIAVGAMHSTAIDDNGPFLMQD